jgi:hypothetical protein
MKLFKYFVAVLVIGILGLLPIARHLITKNEVNRELDVAMYEYATQSRQQLMKRLDRIAEENELDPETLEITVEDTSPGSIAVTLRYRSKFKVFFIPVTREVVFRKTATSLGA